MTTFKTTWHLPEYAMGLDCAESADCPPAATEASPVFRHTPHGETWLTLAIMIVGHLGWLANVAFVGYMLVLISRIAGREDVIGFVIPATVAGSICVTASLLFGHSRVKFWLAAHLAALGSSSVAASTPYR